MDGWWAKWAVDLNKSKCFNAMYFKPDPTMILALQAPPSSSLPSVASLSLHCLHSFSFSKATTRSSTS